MFVNGAKIHMNLVPSCITWPTKTLPILVIICAKNAMTITLKKALPGAAVLMHTGQPPQRRAATIYMQQIATN